jgi:hypothetical protein
MTIGYASGRLTIAAISVEGCDVIGRARATVVVRGAGRPGIGPYAGMMINSMRGAQAPHAQAAR